MSKKPRRALSLAVYGVSVALHVALAAGAVLAPKAKKNQVVAISLAETHKPPPKKDEPPPPPPPPVKAKAAPATAAAPKPAPQAAPKDAPPPTAAAPEAFADLGLTMGNGGAGGLAIPTGPRPVATTQEREVTKKVRALAPAAADACDEPIVKAKLRSGIATAEYTAEARSAQIEGVVRVEITIDEHGAVAAVKVLKGLGYGLDEAAAKAAKLMTFEPGTRCGKASVTTFKLGIRFSLGQ